MRPITSWLRTKPLIVITGATGTGKSQLAIEIARHFNGEVINADALQLYQGLPVATNKLRHDEMNGIAHHLFDCIAITEDPWYVGKYVKAAERIIDEIHGRGRLPVITGGTHYYIHSLLFKNCVDELEIADQSEQDSSRWPVLQGTTAQMLEELSRLDPIAATWWHPSESRKIQRSLAICLKTGQRVSETYEDQKKKLQAGDMNAVRYQALCLYLHSDRAKLNERLDVRVDGMLGRGLLDEARLMRRERINQLEQGNSIEMDKGIWVAIGFKEFEPYLNTMENTPASSNSELLKDGTERMKISTRQYAKRQTQYVKHKIWPLFDDGEDRDLFQVLDTSDPGEWGQAVSRPAKSLVQAYLTKSPMNNHSNTTTNDAGFIRRAPQARNTYSCKMCNIIATSEASWESHVKGRRHRKAVR